MTAARRAPLLLASLLVACHAAAPPPVVVAPAPPPALAPAPPPPDPMPALIGSLERPAALATFFTALKALESDGDDVRVAQFGDSHTAADWQTGPMRRQLQARFGDGGRGFVPIGRPWKAWSQEGLLTGNAGDWSTQMNSPTSRRPTGDGVFGLSGVALATRQPGARAWDEILAPSSRVEVTYLAQPVGGSFDLVIDGHVTRVSTRAEARGERYSVVDLSGTGNHHIEVRAIGDGEVRIFGAALDRAEQRGLVFDALGINGARVATAQSWTDAPWEEALRHRAPALAIFAYGTNDAVDVETPFDAVSEGLTDVIQRFRRALPKSSCLVLGPPDRANAPRLVAVIARERDVAASAGCAFFDQVAALGGPGAIAKWGQPDHVHYSREGYAQLATAFVTDVLRAYDLWRAR